METNTYVKEYREQIDKDHSKTIVYEDYFILVENHNQFYLILA